MSKPEWGVKRHCASCESRFYDMRRNPIRCPRCDTLFVVAAVAESRTAKGGGAAAFRRRRAASTADAEARAREEAVHAEPAPDDGDDGDENAADEGNGDDEAQDGDDVQGGKDGG
jgi:uncharacterized protein (TIGR02300 family)